MCSARRLMVFDVCVKFHEICQAILNLLLRDTHTHAHTHTHTEKRRKLYTPMAYFVCRGYNKVFTVIKQLKMQEYSKDSYLSLNYYNHVIFISMFPQTLTSCILNIVDKQLT